MIKLVQFNDSDYPQLIAEVSDARFLLQWAGPKYAFPLDRAQLDETLAVTRGGKPSFQVFKAMRPGTSEAVGHIQLMNIDYDAKHCVLGRVLIFAKYRGNGFGEELVKAALRFAFENVNLNEVFLGVFDFNTSAIKLYKKIGFSEFEYLKGARQYKDESWDLIRMKISREDWL